MKAYFIARSSRFSNPPPEYEHDLVLFRFQSDRDWLLSMEGTDPDKVLVTVGEGEIPEDSDLSQIFYMMILAEGENGLVHHVQIRDIDDDFPLSLEDLEHQVELAGQRVISICDYGWTDMLYNEETPEQPLFKDRR